MQDHPTPSSFLSREEDAERAMFVRTFLAWYGFALAHTLPGDQAVGYERVEAQPGMPPAGVLPGCSDITAPIDLGGVVIDGANRRVLRYGEEVDLTTAEFDVLWLLASHRGRVVTRERIFHEVRGIDYDGLDRSMDLRIMRLRKKLHDNGKKPQLIKTVRGVGYLMVVTV